MALQRVEEIRNQGHADLLADYFEPISILAQAVVLGIDREDISSLRNWVRDLAIGASNFDKDPIMQGTADAASSEMSRVLQPLIEQESAQPSTSLISDLLHRGREEGCPRRPDEVLPTLKVLMIGGAQEPGHASASTLYALFCHPDQLRDVQEDSSLLGSAVNETLRWMSPIGTQTRQTTQSVTIAGSRIPQGERVAALISSANRDNAIFQEPDRFNIYRRDGRNAAFGFGPHACVGSLFTRKSSQVMLEVILHALPNMRPDGSKPTLLRGWEFRGPRALYVVWD
ncbi:cytochrome P450 [Streptomyces sp. CA-251387]|uniref:cytochrome P450 n=1 Tax=Streptomyces sp. CA-251387 TaxID=3240064 RepID=UPI003D92619B